MSDEEIDKFVPKTQYERDIMRKKKTVNELQLMREIELLKEQVKELQVHVFNGTATVKSEASIDSSVVKDALPEESKATMLKEDKELKEAESDKV